MQSVSPATGDAPWCEVVVVDSSGGVSRGQLVLVTRTPYVRLQHDANKLYCHPLDAERAQFLLTEGGDALTLVKRLGELRAGIVVLETAHATYIYAPPFARATCYWMQDGNRLLVSDSAASLARRAGSQVRTAALAMHLLDSLPFYPFIHEAMWENVQTLRPLDALCLEPGADVSTVQVWQLPPTTDDKTVTSLIRERLLGVISTFATSAPRLSADLSGGVDSAAIAYVLKALRADFRLFHARADSVWNSDTEWALKVSRDMGQPVSVIDGLQAGSRAFSMTSPYPGDARPDAPIYWSDSEGYAGQVAQAGAGNGSALHLIGIGGDELFSEMPAFAWSLVRQNRWRSLDITFQYSFATRNSLWRGARDLADSQSYEEALRRSLDAAFRSRSQRDGNSSNRQAWLADVSVPQYLTDSAREMAQSHCQSLLGALPGPLDRDRSRHQALESLLFQARVTDQLNNLFGQDLVWDSPYLDLHLVERAAALPLRGRTAGRMTKQPLYQSLKGLVPEQIFTRPVKGEYSAALYGRYRTSRKSFSADLSESVLADLGLIDVTAVRKQLSMPTARGDDIASLERLAAVERWARHFL